MREDKDSEKGGHLATVVALLLVLAALGVFLASSFMDGGTVEEITRIMPVK